MKSMMENSSLGNYSHDEGKLYAVDSLNNLNEQRLCVAQSHYQTVWKENSDNNGCLVMQSSMKCPSWFFVTLIISLIVCLTLVSFVIILIVHTGDKMDEVSKKLVQERKSIEDLQKLNDMILQYLNQTEWRENIGNLSTVQTGQFALDLPD